MRVNNLDQTMSPITTGPQRDDYSLDREARSTGPLDLQKLIKVVRWRARMITIVTIMTVVVAGVGLLVLPAKFKATTVVLVDPRQPRVTASEAVLSGIGQDAAAVESQVELIQSSALAKRVIEKLGLDQDPEFAKPGLLDAVRAAAASMFGGASADDEATRLNRLVY